jgi:hypothetical protein
MALGITAASALVQLARATGGAIVIMIMEAVRDRHRHGKNTRQMAVRRLVRMVMDPATVAM